LPPQQSFESTEQKFRNFLDVEHRRHIVQEKKFSPMDFYEQIFEDIYIKYKAFLPKEYNSACDNPFFEKIKENINLEQNANGDKNCDEVFFEYLKVLSNKCNQKYFIFAFKFVVLFRECLNRFKVNEKDPSREFTQVYNSDQVPDLCNEFINEFMENADFFGLNTEDDKLELIEIIQHFCFWLFENQYTTSRLSLLSN
jgi:hypothetical protein